MEKNNKNLGKDELKRALLLMKYDSKKTLTENIESTDTIKEQASYTSTAVGTGAGAATAVGVGAVGAGLGVNAVPGAVALGTALGLSAAAGAAIIGGAAGLALTPLVMWYIDKDNAKGKVEKMLNFCNTHADKIKSIPVGLNDSQIFELSDRLFDALEGVGTNEEEVSNVFKSLKTVSDVCNLQKTFNDEQSESLIEWLDSDIDATDEWNTIYRPLRNIIRAWLLTLKDETQPNPEEKTKCPQGQFYNPATKKCQTSNCGGCIPSLCPKGTKSVNGKCVKTSKYKACTGFPLNLFCVNSEIGKVQKCLGLKQDNALGPKTQQSLKDEGIELPLTADGVKKACSPEQLTPKLTTIPTQQTSEPELKENYKVIKKKIRENLIETKENKKNLIVEESIIKNRFSVIVENRQLKTKKEKEKFYFDVLVEMKRLNDQGFKSKLITESFFDIISGFFGKSGSGILQTIKEYFGNWLIEKLGVDTKGWIGGTIVKTIGNLDIADIPKLTNCTFTTKLLSKSLAENAVSKLQTAAGLEGTLSNIMRNTLVETLEENSTFMVKIEEALGSVLCPLISNVSGKLEDAASAMKEKAIAK